VSAAKHSAEKVQFYLSEKDKADLKIKLYSDGMTQSGFFAGVAKAYLSGDHVFYDWFARFRNQESDLGGKRKKAIVEKEEENARQTMKKFGFDQEEIESIFDLIEKEYSEL